jgi:hypothetical protein
MSAILAVVLAAIGVVILAGTVATSRKRNGDTIAATRDALGFIPLGLYVLLAYLIWVVAS